MRLLRSFLFEDKIFYSRFLRGGVLLAVIIKRKKNSFLLVEKYSSWLRAKVTLPLRMSLTFQYSLNESVSTEKGNFIYTYIHLCINVDIVKCNNMKLVSLKPI